MMAIKIIRDSLPARVRNLMMCGFETNGGVRGTSFIYKKKREMGCYLMSQSHPHTVIIDMTLVCKGGTKGCTNNRNFVTKSVIKIKLVSI